MSNLINKEKTALVVVDIQEKLLPRIRFHNLVVNNTLLLIEYAKIADIPIIVTEQYPRGMGHTIKEISNAIPDFNPITKVSFGCFGEKEFKRTLERFKPENLIITGIETHVCICQTVLEGLADYSIYVPVDAVSSQNKGDWVTALERMKENGTDLVSTEMLLFEMMKEAGTGEFKKMLPFIKEKHAKEKKGPIIL